MKRKCTIWQDNLSNAKGFLNASQSETAPFKLTKAYLCVRHVLDKNSLIMQRLCTHSSNYRPAFLAGNTAPPQWGMHKNEHKLYVTQKAGCARQFQNMH
mmetsp:Transcript_15857/g.26362  ORF Transcript_15857/g.26362 Transcript_15857/m.26362 type:complete len:99 (+) Transcript_15857:45-341(+)